MNSKRKIFVSSMLFVALALQLSSSCLFAFENNSVSRDPNDWNYLTLDPRKIDLFGERFIQTEYIFRSSEESFCLKNCPYAYPYWDGSIDMVNQALKHIGIPRISKLQITNDRSGRVYTDPNYSDGEILIFKGKYFDHLWKVIIRKR